MIKTAKVWFPWTCQYGMVTVNKASRSALSKATKIGKIYYCILPSIEKKLIPLAKDFHGTNERLF